MHQYWFTRTQRSGFLFHFFFHRFTGASQMALAVKNLPAIAGDIRDVGSVPVLGRSLAEGRHVNPIQYLAWKIPWTEDPSRQQSIESQGVRHNWSDLACPHLFINCNKCTILSNMLIIGKSIRVEVEWVYWTLCTICSKFCIILFYILYIYIFCIIYRI